MRRVDRAAPLLPLLVPSGAFDLAERQRIAGLLARTPVTYETSIAVLSTDADARELVAVLERFSPRFEAWWRERGLAGGAAPFDRFAGLLADPFLSSFIETAASFYEAELPAGPTLEFHLIVQPASSRRLKVAYQLERHAAIEVPEGGNPDALIEVLAHEVFHCFFSSMRPESRSALLDRVCASGDPFAVASFGDRTRLRLTAAQVDRRAPSAPTRLRPERSDRTRLRLTGPDSDRTRLRLTAALTGPDSGDRTRLRLTGPDSG